ncbi:MAG TPA: peptidylprolyl isomerase [Candidatus Limnocylindrales bacterium]|nr:peptidylprolyl isomerase [Candidatus Limnocylindrales bacterium]
MKHQKFLSAWLVVLFFWLVLGPPALLAQTSSTKGTIVEEIVARVNNDIITLSDYQKAEAALRQEITQDCQNCTPDRLNTLFTERHKDLLRDLIDQQLLIQRGKDEGLSVESEVIKRLDEVRKQNNLPTLDDLEKAVEGEGMSWEDYKAQLRNSLLTQEVVRHEMGSRIIIGSDEIKKYYDEHPQEFTRPEQVVLQEIFLSTEKKTPEEMAAVERKIEDYRHRILKGEDFGEIAKRYSEGTTAKQGGDLGVFERGQLSKQLEDAVFSLNKGGITEVIQTKTGFEVLKVVEHYQAGLQPLNKVEGEIQNKLYFQKMQPAMRTYLAQLREESYVMVRPGYTDTAAVAGASIIQEVAPTPDTPQKTGKKKLPKPKAAAS